MPSAGLEERDRAPGAPPAVLRRGCYFGPIAHDAPRHQNRGMLGRIACSTCLLALLVIPAAMAGSGSVRPARRLSERYAPLVARFDSLYDRVPADSVVRYLDAVEARAPGDTALRVLLNCARALGVLRRGRYDLALGLAEPVLI